MKQVQNDKSLKKLFLSGTSIAIYSSSSSNTFTKKTQKSTLISIKVLNFKSDKFYFTNKI